MLGMSPYEARVTTPPTTSKPAAIDTPEIMLGMSAGEARLGLGVAHTAPSVAALAAARASAHVRSRVFRRKCITPPHRMSAGEALVGLGIADKAVALVVAQALARACPAFLPAKAVEDSITARALREGVGVIRVHHEGDAPADMRMPGTHIREGMICGTSE